MDLPVLSWLDDIIRDSFTSVFNGVNEYVEAMDLFNKLKKAHFESLIMQVGSIKILGMPYPVSLEKLYYPTRVSTDIRRRIYTSEWTNLSGHKETRKKNLAAEQAGDSYANKFDRIVVLGGPGAGKTTFLKFLALAYSNQDILKKTNLESTYFPIFVHLPSLAKDNCDVIDYISTLLLSKGHIHARAFYQKIFKDGKAAIFLDSLDEVPKEHRSRIVSEINSISQTYPNSKVIVSCRTADYEQILLNFCEVELARLTRDAVCSIVNAWFDKDKSKGELLISLLNNDDTVGSLTETPLLLSLLCIQFKNDLALPKIRTELYRRCVDALLRDWDTTRGFRRDTAYSQLSDDRKERIFESVAGNSCDVNVEYEMLEETVLEYIANAVERFGLDSNDAKGILREIESHHGILEKSSVNTFEFSHGTMHEYFAARYFIAKRQEFEILKKKFHDEQWHNIILFMVSIVDDSTAMLEFLVGKSSMESKQNYPALASRLSHLLLLYRCLAAGVSIPAKTRILICDHLVNSQIQMLKIINKDGVLPYAVKTKTGVRNVLFTYKKIRPTINNILQPYRSLMNEIISYPISEYIDSALKRINIVSSIEENNTFEKIGILTCLLVPISDACPTEFISRMMGYSSFMMKEKSQALKAVLVESIQEHERIHGKILN
ncbi:MAG: hypothetical protein H6R07_1729 [Proteobacteria bacterium]|nr:hypothetical protein [Pseudomonadota bacterium]